eukprot:9001979-Ditylum_brightwellii.AAC.1
MMKKNTSEKRKKISKSRKRKLNQRPQAMANISEQSKDLATGVYAITRVANSTWCKWTDRSTLHLCRWIESFNQEACDGSPLFVQRDLLPSYWTLSRLPADPNDNDKLKQK